MTSHPLNGLCRRLCLIIFLLLAGCGAESLFEDDEADTVIIDIVNKGDTRITFMSLTYVLLLQPPDSMNELQNETLSPGETQRLERNCLTDTTFYLHIRWESGGLRNYRLVTRCGTVVTYELPQ